MQLGQDKGIFIQTSPKGVDLVSIRDGKPAGEPQADGTFPGGTVYGMAMAKLQEFIPEKARQGDAAGTR